MSRLDVGIQFFAPAYGSLRWYLDGKKIGSEEVSAAFGDVNAVVDGTTVTVLWNEAVLTSHDYGVELDMVTYEQDGDNGNVYAISKKSTGEPTLIVNGTTIQTVIVNDTEVDKVIADGATVFEKTGLIVLGFTGLTNESGALTLTDDVADFAGWQTTVVGENTIVTNPLDDVFPYNAIEEFTDDSGNVFVKYPKFYMKWVLDSSGNIDGWKISNQKVDDTYFLNDAFLSPTGAENDYFALGKYEMSGSSSKGYSKSGQTCLVSITRANARAAARAYGDSPNQYNGYQQEDIAQFTVYNFLCMMYYRTANIQTVYGGRTGAISSWSEAASTGSCDGVTGLNGWNATTECVKMLGIENPYGNIWKWIDGVCFSSATIYAHHYPRQYADSTSNGTALGFSRPTSSTYIKSLKHGTAVKTQSYVYCSATGGSASQYYGDYNWYSPTGTVLLAGGFWNSTSPAGLWSLDGYRSSSAYSSNVGARLSYRPL